MRFSLQLNTTGGGGTTHLAIFFWTATMCAVD